MTDTKGAAFRPLSSNFTITNAVPKFSVITDAAKRYLDLLQPSKRYAFNANTSANTSSATTSLPLLATLHINVSVDALPTYQFGDTESYNLTFTATSSFAVLTSNTVVGALRGLETFAQIIESDPVRKKLPLTVPVVNFSLQDAPRYSYRGLMMDLSRHYYSMEFIQHTIDAMAANKLNVLHLHLTDDQSFPIESEAYPELAQKGAFSYPALNNVDVLLTYSKKDLLSLEQYASSRGVVLLPELDMPAHSSSWGAAHPEIMVSGSAGCSERLFQHGDTLNPILDATYEIIDALLEETGTSLFPSSPFIHLGGDEVPINCWKSSTEIEQWMLAHNIKKDDYNALESYFVNRVANGTGLKSTKKILVYWEEIFNNGVQLAKDVIIQAWKSNAMSGIIRAGLRTTNSYKWYLNHGCNNYGDGNWGEFYTNDPMIWANTTNDNEKKLVLGGETTMWSECVDEHSFDSIVWPRASAAAEQLWSAESTTKEATNVTSMRLSEFRCRLIGRGVRAAPIDDSVGSISPRDVNIGGCM